jgi:arabinose-5-phosphate isomerase
MTLNPKTIEKDALAAKALQIMEKFSITAIIVNNEDGTPEGVVHVHDLLKAGVA